MADDNKNFEEVRSSSSLEVPVKWCSSPEIPVKVYCLLCLFAADVKQPALIAVDVCLSSFRSWLHVDWMLFFSAACWNDHQNRMSLDLLDGLSWFLKKNYLWRMHYYYSCYKKGYDVDFYKCYPLTSFLWCLLVIKTVKGHQMSYPLQDIFNTWNIFL